VYLNRRKRLIVRTVAGLFIPALFASCATFKGSELTTVMVTACAYETTFINFKNCVDRAWNADLITQENRPESLALQFNSRMQLLAEGVTQQRISDIDAISHAINLAYQLRVLGESEISYQSAVLRQFLEESATNTSNTAPSPLKDKSPVTVYCAKIRDSSRQIYAFSGIACPFGYAPRL